MNKWLSIFAGIALLATAGCMEEKQNDEGISSQEAASVSNANEHAGWMTDFEAAKALAKEEGKHILIDFSGSDWCGWCIKLDKEVFSQSAFMEYAKENLVLMLVDFPNDKSGQSASVQKQNEKLKEAFGVGGFPTVYVLTPEGKSIAKTGYRAGGPEAYVDHIKTLIAEAE